MVTLDKGGIKTSTKKEGKVVNTLIAAYDLDRDIQRLGWPGYVVRVGPILRAAGLRIHVEGSIDDHVSKQMAKLRGFDGSRYQWDETATAFPGDIELASKKLVEGGWELHSFAHFDVAEASVHDQLLLGYEPGLGKTRASLAWASLKTDGLILVVAPRRLHAQWKEEIARLPIDPDRIRLVSYTDLWRFEDQHPECDVAILDEAHAIKNTNTLRFEAANNLAAAKRMALTGTPIGGYVQDIKGIILWLTKHVPYANTIGPDFAERYGVTDGNVERPGITMGRSLREKVAHLVKIRTRSEPDVTIEKQVPLMFMKKIPMEKGLLQFYLQNARAVREWWLTEEAHTEARARLGVSRLIKAASLPQSLSGWGNAETDLQRMVLDWAHTAGSGTIIMTSHISTAQFYAGKLGVVPVTGELPIARRNAIIDEFRNGGDFLVGTTGVLGEGWNLQRGHTIIFAELDWRAWIVVQAMYRIIRPGQDSIPTIVFAAYRDSVGDYMAATIAAKAKAMLAFNRGADATPQMPRFKELLTRLVFRERSERSNA